MEERQPKRPIASRNGDCLRRALRQAQNQAECPCNSIGSGGSFNTFRFAPRRKRPRALSLCNSRGPSTLPTKSSATPTATYVQGTRPANDNVARLASLPRDVAGRCRSTAGHSAGSSRPRVAGSHTADLFARDSGRPAQSGRKSREASYWTQMDPSFGSRTKAQLASA
jgi:hypothetical protein